MNLDDIIRNFHSLSPEEQAATRIGVHGETRGMFWFPNPGPQMAAYFSKADELFYGGEGGGGKMLSINELIPSTNGFVRMGDIRVGDVVFDEHGVPCRVTVVSPVQTAKTYRLRFDDGSAIECCSDHLWFTITSAEMDAKMKHSPEWRKRRRAERPSRAKGKKSAVFVASIVARNSLRTVRERTFGSVKTTQQIVDTLFVKRDRRNHAIPVAGALQLPQTDLPIPPYTLGAWLGDGGKHGGGFTGIDAHIWKRIEAEGFKVSHSPNVRKSHFIRGLTKYLRIAGVWMNKHVPPVYLRASESQRLALLQGLMDTDGHAALDGGCEFDNTNRNLIDAVYELACSFGIKASITEGIAKLNGRIIGPKWRVRFTTNKPVFSLPRKVVRLKTKVRPTSQYRYIVAAKEIEPILMRCIAVDSPTHLYLAGKSFIPTHNTDLLLGVALNSHTRTRLMRRLNGEVQGLVDRMADILGAGARGLKRTAPYRYRTSHRIIDFSGCQHDKDWEKYQGDPRDCLGFDELPNFTRKIYTSLVGWNRTTKKDQRVRSIATGNKPTTPEGMWVIEYWAPWLDKDHPNPALDGELRWFTTVNGKDTEIENYEGGPVIIDGKTLLDHHGQPIFPKSRTFIRAELQDNPDLAETGYAARLAAMDPELRAAVFEADFSSGMTDSPSQLFSVASLEAAMARWNPIGREGPMTTIAIDVAHGGAANTALAPRHGNFYDQIIVKPGKDTPDGPAVAALFIAHQRNNCTCTIDMGGGYGISTRDHLKNKVTVEEFVGSAPWSARDRSGFLKFRNTRTAAHWHLRELLDPVTGANIAIPPDPLLKQELLAIHYQDVNSVIVVEPKENVETRIGRTPDRSDALIMAAFARGETNTGKFGKGSLQTTANTSGRNPRRRH